MPFPPNANNPTRDRRAEFGLADAARAEKRQQDDTRNDPAASKWRYQPAPRVVKPSTDPLEESPKCTEADAHLLSNDDHHGQR